MYFSQLFFVLFCFIHQKCQCLTRVPLTGDGWTVIGDLNKTFITINTSIPTDIYMSLYKSNLIPDPYIDKNDVELRNISWTNWTFSRNFSVDASFQSYHGIILIANGIDTVSFVYLNDQLIGTTDNMFRRYVFDVASHMNFTNPASNALTIKFESPLKYALNQASEYKHKYGYNVPPDCPPKWQHGECYVNFIRKMQSSYSWDWGPAFPIIGIQDKQLSLVGFDSCVILQFSVVPTMKTGQQSIWILNVDFFIYCAQSLLKTNFMINIEEIDVKFLWTSRVVAGYNRIQNYTSVPSAKIQLWWPNGFGDQKLYTVQGTFQALSESELRSLNIGFRTVELVQEPVPNFVDGLTFYWKINNVPIFLKGSNWIPADSFLDRITTDRLHFYFASMKEAHFNALRVWGGGVYETDEFYDLADKYGIMIFQDMMFASSLYPTNPEFLDSVSREVFDQVNRLKHRPCIIVWSGNNENEAALTSGWFKLDAPYDMYRADYVKLYNDTIYSVINSTDFYSRPFVMSSPSNGVNTTRSGGVDFNPYSTLYGDTHVYSYLANAWNHKNYPVPRCCTEFGFQSYPLVETLLSALQFDQLTYFNPSILHRQHHPAGQLELLEEILIHFDLLACKLGSSKKNKSKKKYKNVFKVDVKSEENVEAEEKNCLKNKMMGPYFEEIVYLTQIHQAMAYKTETEHYRRWRSTVNESTGEGLTMCALYWQLNDIWQAPTWASIDYGMKWKMVHYFAKNFFAPILVSPVIEGETLKVSVISDLLEPLDGVSLLIDIHSWSKFEPVRSYNIPLKTIPPSSATVVYHDVFPNVLGPASPENVDLFFNTVLHIGDKILSVNNVIFPRSFRQIPKNIYGKVTITEVKKTKVGTFTVGLTTTALAPFVWLNVRDILGWFSDNGFTMLTKNLEISFIAWNNSTTLSDVQSNLTVMSLGDLYRSQK